jgi:hypothetical protein
MDEKEKEEEEKKLKVLTVVEGVPRLEGVLIPAVRARVEAEKGKIKALEMEKKWLERMTKAVNEAKKQEQWETLKNKKGNERLRDLA